MRHITENNANACGALNWRKQGVERCTSTRSGLFELLGRDFKQVLEQIVSVSVKVLSNTNLVTSRSIKREKGSLPVDVRRSKSSLLNSLRLVVDS